LVDKELVEEEKISTDKPHEDNKHKGMFYCLYEYFVEFSMLLAVQNFLTYFCIENDKMKLNNQKYKSELSDMVKMFKPKFNQKNAKQNLSKLKSGLMSNSSKLFPVKLSENTSLKTTEEAKTVVLNPEDEDFVVKGHHEEDEFEITELKNVRPALSDVTNKLNPEDEAGDRKVVTPEYNFVTSNNKDTQSFKSIVNRTLKTKMSKVIDGPWTTTPNSKV
jgi:hypothetical protein